MYNLAFNSSIELPLRSDSQRDRGLRGWWGGRRPSSVASTESCATGPAPAEAAGHSPAWQHQGLQVNIPPRFDHLHGMRDLRIYWSRFHEVLDFVHAQLGSIRLSRRKSSAKMQTKLRFPGCRGICRRRPPRWARRRWGGSGSGRDKWRTSGFERPWNYFPFIPLHLHKPTTAGKNVFMTCEIRRGKPIALWARSACSIFMGSLDRIPRIISGIPEEYWVTRQDVPLEMEGNRTTADLMAWFYSAWVLLSFSPFPVRHPV